MSNKFTGTGPAGRAANSPDGEPCRAMPLAVLDVQIVQRGRRWKWQVRNQLGLMLMQGWEQSRSLARYRGYRALLLLLRANCVRAPLRANSGDMAPQPLSTEKGRPVARTAFPVSRRRHIERAISELIRRGPISQPALIGAAAHRGSRELLPGPSRWFPISVR